MTGFGADDWSELIAELEIEVAGRSLGLEPTPAGRAAWEEFVVRLRACGQVLKKYNPDLATADIDDAIEDLVVKYQDPAILRLMARNVAYHNSFFVSSLRNRITDEQRRRGRASRREGDVARELYRSEDENVVDEATGDADRRARVESILTNLSANDRDLIEKRLFEGLSLVEIARIRGVPYGTLTSRWGRLMKHLQAHVPEEDGQ